MSSQSPVSRSVFEALRDLDSCVVSNAIERSNFRLRNEGFISKAVRCRFPHLPPMVGYAVTAHIRTSSAPMNGCCYFDHMDWWTYLASMPEPRIMVFQDVDHSMGLGALVGEIHATIGQALNCVGCVTNGAVRDLAAVDALDFPLFSGSVSVSHAYAHIVDFGNPVEVGGLSIHPGDLLHGDRNGVQLVPLEIAEEIPDTARRLQEQERELIEFCRSNNFSLKGLADHLKSVSENGTPALSGVSRQLSQK
jgi:regulator of RNase E activity RraA